MGETLESSYDWRPPVVASTVALIVGIALLARGQAPGWVAAGAVLLLCDAIYLAVVWVRTRAYVRVDGPVLTVRRFRAFSHVEGGSVVKVTQDLTSRGPCHTLTVRGADGRLTRHRVPTARVRRGHATLFAWILAWAPQAELDRGSRRTLQTLRERGALPYPDNDVPTTTKQSSPKQTDRE